MTWEPRNWHAEYGIDGIDISEYQPYLDLRDAHDAGIELVIIKAYEGGRPDPLYDTHMTQAIVLGFGYLASYLFLRNQSPARQAGEFIDTIHPYLDGGALRPGQALAIDYENHDPTGTPAPPPETLCSVIAELETTLDARGRVAWYTTTSYADNLLEGPFGPFLADRPLWLADRTPTAPEALERLRPALWQHAVGPFCPWYQADLDCNHIVDRARLDAWFAPKPTTPPKGPEMLLIQHEGNVELYGLGAPIDLGGLPEAFDTLRARGVPLIETAAGPGYVELRRRVRAAALGATAPAFALIGTATTKITLTPDTTA